MHNSNTLKIKNYLKALHSDFDGKKQSKVYATDSRLQTKDVRYEGSRINIKILYKYIYYVHYDLC